MYSQSEGSSQFLRRLERKSRMMTCFCIALHWDVSQLIAQLDSNQYTLPRPLRLFAHNTFEAAQTWISSVDVQARDSKVTC